MEHLLDFFDRYVRGDREAVRYDDGIRRWSYSFDDLRATAESFATRLETSGVGAGDRLMLWSHNRPEWLPVFWGCVLRGVVVIPLDGSATVDLARRIATLAAPRVVVAGRELQAGAARLSLPHAWSLCDLAWIDARAGGRAEAIAAPAAARAAVTAASPAEIVFTSGTTGEPKGVVVTHGNIVANIGPLARAAGRYRRYLWAFRPLRFLNLLPLSHMFGQALSVFVPPVVAATTVFIAGHEPRDVVAHIRRHRITLAVTVPRMLEVWRQFLGRAVPACATPSAEPMPLIRRLWRHRAARRPFGWRFVGFVVGGARLDHDLETYWRRLGFAVVQGYGLTETAPIVAWNDPFHVAPDTVGRPLEGVEVRIAPDGEVLVRGPSVTAGYLVAPDTILPALEAGWFHTGDLGAFDAAGTLRIHGRKKDVIVTPEGVHVQPEVVERALESVDGVKDAAVVAGGAAADRVHAVLVLAPGVDADAVVRRVNATLPPGRGIRDFSVWTAGPLPRTDVTRKLRRHELRRWVAAGTPPPTSAPPAARGLPDVLATYARGHTLTPGTTLDELGLSSLDRLELALALESDLGAALSDTAFAASRTVADLQRAVDAAATRPAQDDVLAMPRWARRRGTRAVGRAVRALVLPLARLFVILRVDGRAHLDGVRAPVMFAANHQSLLDTPVILMALPAPWRHRLAVATGTRFFAAYFTPAGHTWSRRLLDGALYGAVALVFRAFPLPEAGPGTRASLHYAGELVSTGVSLLVFPEGRRTDLGEVGPFQPGVGLMAARLQVPVVPVRLAGLDRVLHRTWRWPRRGAARVTFGAPLECGRDEDYTAFAARLEHAVRALVPDAESVVPASPVEHRVAPPG